VSVARFWHELWPQVFAVAFLVGVLGNLVASAILGIPAVTHLHRQASRHHRERMAQAAEHHQVILSAIRDQDRDR